MSRDPCKHGVYECVELQCHAYFELPNWPCKRWACDVVGPIQHCSWW